MPWCTTDITLAFITVGISLFHDTHAYMSSTYIRRKSRALPVMDFTELKKKVLKSSVRLAHRTHPNLTTNVEKYQDNNLFTPSVYK